MNTLSSFRFGIAILFLAAATTAAQNTARTITIRGSVFDSLRGRPLRHAFITMDNGSRVADTDTEGRFRIDSVPPGLYTITAQHPLLDSIGLSGLAVSASLRTGSREIVLAVPSFQTLWHASCPGAAPPDSGIVFGTVRHVSNGRPVANAAVQLAWVDVMLGDQKQVVERHWNMDTRTNADGGFAFCNVPRETGVTVRAKNDSASSGTIETRLNPQRIVRRDLMMAATTRGAAHGTITGMVFDTTGAVVIGARVRFSDDRETRTDAKGRFTLRDIPAGTQQIEVLTLGSAPMLEVAEVPPGDTALVIVRVLKVVELDPVEITGVRVNRVLATEFNDRRRSGFGYTRDSTELRKYTELINALRDVPSLNIRYVSALYGSSGLAITVPDGHGSSCQPDIRIDGVLATPGHLVDLEVNEVAGIEVYPRASQVPARYARPGIQPKCGAVLVWTLYGFRNR